MRYALYFTPPADHALTKTASAWLGRNAFDNALISPTMGGFTVEEHGNLVAEPARYGFHATLKAPFALASDKTPVILDAFFAEFCEREAPTLVPRLELTEIGSFFALTCGGGSEGINRLCSAAVEAFEPFRAPLTADDMARRRPERLSERQRELLERFGYPYVFEEFRFHMTLTGPVKEEDKPRVREALRSLFADYLDRPLPIEHIGLFVEPQRSQPFTVLRHAALRGAAS